MKKNFKILQMLVLVSALALPACTQTTPSMMNESAIQLSQTTIVEQVLFEDINDNVLSALSSHYLQNGTSALDLTMTYNPTSKNFTAMNAVHELGHIKDNLKKNGVTSVTTQTMAVPNGVPSLMVSYDMVQALAPHDCATMPGLERNGTTRFLGQYKFGCSVDTMVARQIAHPADLQGNSGLGTRDARREALILDGYSGAEPSVPLEGLERDGLTSE